MGEEITTGAGRWQGQAYASHSAHHRAVADSFVQRCPPEPADEVVDAGCGSGEFTVRLAGLAPDGRLVGVEPDPSMLASAREHAANNVEFRQGTLQELDQVCGPASADLAARSWSAVLRPVSRYGLSDAAQAPWRLERGQMSPLDWRRQTRQPRHPPRRHDLG